MMNRSAFAFFLCAAGLRAAPIFDPSEAAVLDQQGANGTVVAAPLFDPSKVAVLDEQGANGTVVADFFSKKKKTKKVADGATCEDDDDCVSGRCGGADPRKCFPVLTGYPIYIGGDDYEDIKHKPVDYMPASILYRLPIGTDVAKQITVNETHASIPLRIAMTGQYARDLRSVGTSEEGLVNLMWAPNPESVMSDNTLVSAQAKVHTLSHSGLWHTRSADRVKKELAARSKETQKLAREERHARYKLVFATSGGLINLPDRCARAVALCRCLRSITHAFSLARSGMWKASST